MNSETDKVPQIIIVIVIVIIARTLSRWNLLEMIGCEQPQLNYP
jgi:hypothetical protein